MSAQLQFALLEHTTRDGTHWDLLIETAPGAPLRTWRLAQDPTRAHGPIDATPIGDHRRIYLEFEGEIAGDRGRVRRVDRGHAKLINNGVDCVGIALEGMVLKGEFRIVRSLSAGEGNSCLLLRE